MAILGIKVRPSCYLNAVETGDGNSLLYNGFSMCIDVVPSEIAHRLNTSGELVDISFLTPEEQDHLIKRGHLTRLSIEDEQEEMGKLARAIAKREVEPDMQAVQRKTLTFILTYKCNLSCAYCYQHEVRKMSDLSSMSEEFVDDFFSSYLDKLMPGGHKDNLFFQLYGGEPFLPENRGAIERILQYAKKHGIFIFTVTNAVMLPEMLDLIGPEKGKINFVQVTLDGGQMFHDEKRVSESGAPTFEQTVRALRDLMKTGAHAIVRIHVHPGRLESARALVEYLEREKILGNDRVKVYFWSTEDLHSKAISPEEYELFCKLFQDVTFRQSSLPTAHFAFVEQIMDMKTIESWPVRSHCNICVAGLHSIIDPFGDIYECLDDAGHKDRRVGALVDGEVKYFRRGGNYGKPHLHDKPECLRCSVALYCRGGCPNRFKIQDDSMSASFCLQIKEFVSLSLQSSYLLRKNNACKN